MSTLNFAYLKRRSYAVCVLMVVYFIFTPHTNHTHQTIKAVYETRFKTRRYNKLIKTVIHHMAKQMEVPDLHNHDIKFKTNEVTLWNIPP